METSSILWYQVQLVRRHDDKVVNSMGAANRDDADKIAAKWSEFARKEMGNAYVANVVRRNKHS